VAWPVVAVMQEMEHGGEHHHIPHAGEAQDGRLHRGGRRARGDIDIQDGSGRAAARLFRSMRWQGA
jgi:hypothetical protein